MGERGINVGHIFVDELEFHTLKTDGCVVVKKSSFCLKLLTRMSLVAKKRSFSAQSDDEKGSHCQKIDFSASKW